jgi:hypothetical protein
MYEKNRESDNIDDKQKSGYQTETECNDYSHNKLSKKTKKILIGTGALIGAGIITVSAFFAGENNHNINHQGTPVEVSSSQSSKPSSKPSSTVESAVSSSTSNETSSTSKTETLPTVESLELDPSLLSDPEKLAENWAEKNDEWVNGGATVENAQAWDADNSSKSANDYAAQIASKYDDVFIKALLVKDWQSNGTLKNYVSDYKNGHLDVLESYLKTSGHYYPQDKEPYTRQTKYDKLISYNKNSDGSYDLRIIESLQDNSDKNRFLTLSEGAALVTTPFDVTFKFIVEDGKVKLSDIGPESYLNK